MVKELLFRAVLEHKKDLAVLLTVNGFTWWSMYYVPIMAALGSTITVITGIVILKKEYLELKRKRAETAKDNSGYGAGPDQTDDTGTISAM